MKHQEVGESFRRCQEASGSIRKAQDQNNNKQTNKIQWLWHLFSVTIFLIMTCYQLHATFSGSYWCLGGNTEALRKHLHAVQTVHFLEGRTPVCTVCTQWWGNIQAWTAKTVHFPHSESENKQILFPEAAAAKPCLRDCMAVLWFVMYFWQATVRSVWSCSVL